MSHQTIYVDIDEEITSIIDRIRKAKADEVIVVTPKRALLIQSLVNLKLLKKECLRRKKKIMIVTQDKIGKKLIEKAGILVHAQTDKLDEREEKSKPVQEQRKPSHAAQDYRQDEEEEDAIGSSDFFTGSSRAEGKSGDKLPAADFEKEESDGKKTGKILKKNASSQKIRKKPKENKIKMSDIVAGTMMPIAADAASLAEKERNNAVVRRETARGNENSDRLGYFASREIERQKNLQTDNFFQSSLRAMPVSSSKEKKMMKTVRIKGRAGKYSVFSISILILLVGFAGAYYYLPSAEIIVDLKSQDKSFSLNAQASTAVDKPDFELIKIPARLEEKTVEKSGEFEATGRKTGAGKAGGKVVVYNEFGPENQTLVGTTRLETSDGKIFRITKTVVVPGMTKVGSENKPGAVEVDVLADKPGEEYNIEPADFKIPGFGGGPKYEKFYAKSSKAMTGGGQGEAATVLAQDIAGAKEKLLSDAKKEIVDSWQKEFGTERKFFENTIKTETLSTDFSQSIGSLAEKFSASSKIRLRTITFSQNEIKAAIAEKAGADQGKPVPVSIDQTLNYILTEADLEKGYLKFEVKTDVSIAEQFDENNFKKGILGKSSDEIRNLMQNYGAVRNVNVKFWPFFVQRVPLNEKRINVEINQSI